MNDKKRVSIKVRKRVLDMSLMSVVSEDVLKKMFPDESIKQTKPRVKRGRIK